MLEGPLNVKGKLYINCKQYELSRVPWVTKTGVVSKVIEGKRTEYICKVGEVFL